MKPSRTLALLGTLLLAGCSATTRYRVLSFFFDGVPRPAGEQQAGGAAATAASRGSAAPFVHGPYAAKLCDACHQRTAISGFVTPRAQLCAQCHDVQPAGTVVHGPFASGECLGCHDPHASPRRYMLVADVPELCERCHDEESLHAVAAHQPFDERCTECHAPHASNQAYLLR